MERIIASPSSETADRRVKAKNKEEILSLQTKGKTRTPAERDRLIDLLVEVVFPD